MERIDEFIEKMPKIELHVHLEGSVQPEMLLRLAEKNDVRLPASDEEGIRSWYTFKNFDNFIVIYLKICECIQTPEDINLMAREFLRNQHRQNILYSEITYTPYTHWIQYRIRPQAQIEALKDASDWARRELGIESRYILDIPREIGAWRALSTARWVKRDRSGIVAALGLGGPEVGFPPEMFKRSFDIVRKAGIVSIPHAGETEGPASVRGALDVLGARRIGHGVRAIEDPELVKRLRDSGTVLEVCPSSNICLGVYKSFEEHSLPRLVEEGLAVTINSDDPPMFNTSLTEEYRRINKYYGFGSEDFLRFNRTAIRGAVLDDSSRAELASKFEKAWPAG